MSEPLAITVLGCDGSYPGSGGACSGYLLSCDSTHIWLDAGSGTLAHLQEHISIEDLNAVVITHQHVDHWSDLEHLAVAAKWVLSLSGVDVYAPEGIRELLRVGTAGDVLSWHLTKPGDQVEIGAVTLTFSQTQHVATTLAVRADGGERSLAYSADTGPEWHLSALGPGLNLAVCEATYLSDHESSDLHLSAAQAGKSAREAGVERLVITHLWPRVDKEVARAEAAAAFGADVSVATIGERYVA